MVADSWDHCIQSFQLDGTFIHKFFTKDSDNGQLNFPSSLTVDPNGFILVTEKNNHPVSIFDKNYNYIHSFGSMGAGKNQFDEPCGIAIVPIGIYISDSSSKRITVY